MKDALRSTVTVGYRLHFFLIRMVPRTARWIGGMSWRGGDDPGGEVGEREEEGGEARGRGE